MVLVQTAMPSEQAQAFAWAPAAMKVEPKAENFSKKPRIFFDLAIEKTPVGRVVVELDVDRAPMTCANFLALCTGSHKNPLNGRLHYKDTIFHRVVPGMYLCGGDVVNNNGTSGMSIYGEHFKDEQTDMKHDVPGVLSMLSHGPNTNNSQFFVNLTTAPWMDGFYVAFGKVISGLDMLQKVSEKYGSESGIPTSDDIRIAECGEL